jgi:hypothetical protein
MAKIAGVGAVIAAVVGLAGCFGANGRDHSGDLTGFISVRLKHPSSQSSTAHERRLTPSEWKSVIRDSYDGKIDHPYRCAAVGEAIERIPHDMTYFGAPGSASGALLAFEKRVG